MRFRFHEVFIKFFGDFIHTNQLLNLIITHSSHYYNIKIKK